MAQMCLWFESALACAGKMQARDMQSNPERWLALYFQDAAASWAAVGVEFGLRWVDIGPAKPQSGQDRAKDPKLMQALQNKRSAVTEDGTTRTLEFTQKEFNELEVKDLRRLDYVEVDGTYFRPFEVEDQPPDTSSQSTDEETEDEDNGDGDSHDAAHRRVESRRRAKEEEDDDPLLALCHQYADKDEVSVLADLLSACRQALCISLPDEPLVALADFFVRKRVVNVETCMQNMRSCARENFVCGQVERWRPLRAKDEPMSNAEIRRTWRVVADAIRNVNLAGAGERRARIDRMNMTLKELIEKGFPINAQPNGPTMVLLCAGMGNDHLPTLTKLFLSGANVQLHHAKDGTLPIEVAAAMGHRDVVLRLHEMGCSVGAAAHYALTESQLTTMHALLEPRSKGGKIGAPAGTRIKGVTVLEHACVLGNVQASLWLINLEGSMPDRRLDPSVCKQHELAVGGTLAHLLAKIGGRSFEVLDELYRRCPRLKDVRDNAGLTPMMVSNSQSILTMDNKYNACWPILQDTILNPEWNRLSDTNQRNLEELLQKAVREGADPAAHSKVGWTCLMAAALCAEPRAARAMLCDTPVLGSDLNDGFDTDVFARQAAHAERVLYATSRSGHTALMWAHWMAWVSEQPPESDDSPHKARAQRAANFDINRRACELVEEFSNRGATLRTLDAAALKHLREAFERGTAEERSLLRFDPQHLTVLGVGDPYGETGSLMSNALDERFAELRNAKGQQRFEFYAPSYRPPNTLEVYLLQLAASDHAFNGDTGRFEVHSAQHRAVPRSTAQYRAAPHTILIEDRFCSAVLGVARHPHPVAT
jgi:ankyrin repeat protein